MMENLKLHFLHRFDLILMNHVDGGSPRLDHDNLEIEDDGDDDGDEGDDDGDEGDDDGDYLLLRLLGVSLLHPLDPVVGLLEVSLHAAVLGGPLVQ